MNLSGRWFTEICDECGSAFSMKLHGKVYEEQSSFQKIEIYETQAFGTLLVLDGFVMLTDLDNFIYHEMMSHPVLYSHGLPRSVVIIGGGDCGTLREVLKHREVEGVALVELDERVTRVCERYFPELCESNADERARFVFEDGTAWIRQAAPDSVDVIIVDSTDPIGPAKGLFSEAFYRDCFEALKPGGLLVQQSESPLFHTESIIRPMREAMRSSGFADLQTYLFPQCTYPSGWWSATMAAKHDEICFTQERQARQVPFATRYYNPAIHQACAALPQFLGRELQR